jgi:hypothetical protein
MKFPEKKTFANADEANEHIIDVWNTADFAGRSDNPEYVELLDEALRAISGAVEYLSARNRILTDEMLNSPSSAHWVAKLRLLTMLKEWERATGVAWTPTAYDRLARKNKNKE